MSENSYKREQVVEIINSVVTRMSAAPGMDTEVLKEISHLQTAIDQMCEDLHFAHPDQIQSHIPSATDELEAVIKSTENAADTIMGACETIQSHLKDRPMEETAPIDAELIRIVEACTFQDLTGQRISKIVKSLREIEIHAQRLSGVLRQRFPATQAPAAEQKGDGLMNGPQLPGQGISQEEIDRLLNDF